MTELQTVLRGLAFGESPRWHDGRLFVSDWGAHEVLAIEPDGSSRVAASVASFPLCLDFAVDGRMLLVSSSDRAVLRQEADGSLSRYADLSGHSEHPWNDIVVDGRGNAYVNTIGFDFPAGDFGPGTVVLVTPDGAVREVADGLAFPNGMAVLSDGATLVVAESYAHRLTAFDIADDGSLVNRRVWAEVGEHSPDGICADSDDAIWYADVASRRCVRVTEGGAVLASIELDRGCFACVLGGSDRRTLYMVTNLWGGTGFDPAARNSVVLATRVEVAGAGHP